MKEKLIIACFALISMPTLAIAGLDDATELPEPSTLGLFVAASIAITVLTKLKK